jgi:alkylhydroperoxidase family enzyme
MAKRANGEGSKPRKKPNGRYEARHHEHPAGRRRVSFYGATAKEAAEKRPAMTLKAAQITCSRTCVTRPPWQWTNSSDPAFGPH